jgi:hypothetical protein
MSLLARLGVVLGLDSAPFKAGLDDATKSTKAFEAQTRKAMRESERNVKEFQAALSKIAGYSAAAGAAILGAFSYADKVSDTAKAFDLTISSLLAMRGALQNAGGEADNMGNLLTRLANTAEEARKGSDKARAAFDQLGISGKEVENAMPDELFALVAQQLSQIEDPIKRNAMAFEILGKAAKGVDWKQYWADYSQGKGTTEQVSAAIEAGAEAWDNLKKAGVAALEAILVLVKPFADFINFLARAAKATQKGTISGSSLDAEFGGAFGMSPVDIGPGPSASKPPTAVGATQNRKSGDYTNPPASQAGFAAATEAVRQQTQELMRQVSIMIKREEVESRLLSMTRNQREIAQEIFRIEEERDRLVANAQREIEIEQKRQVINRDRIKALEDQIELIKYAKEVEIEAVTAVIQKRQEEQQSFTVGWNRAYAQYAEDSQNYAKLGEQAFNTVLSNMDMLLRNFVQTGKLNFKDFAKSIIADLIMIQLRMQAIGLAKMAMRAFSGGIGFGTGIGYGSQDYGQYFADGGQPPINEPAIVGEQGPELFIPRTAGTIIPNQQLSNYMGNQPQIVYNGPYIASMQAIDTQSATQFLARNKEAVYAANLSATRSLPASR